VRRDTTVSIDGVDDELDAGRRDFHRQLCLALDLTPSATAAAVFYAVTTHVEEPSRHV
jgi:hypothetical protein